MLAYCRPSVAAYQAQRGDETLCNSAGRAGTRKAWVLGIAPAAAKGRYVLGLQWHTALPVAAVSARGTFPCPNKLRDLSAGLRAPLLIQMCPSDMESMRTEAPVRWVCRMSRHDPFEDKSDDSGKGVRSVRMTTPTVIGPLVRRPTAELQESVRRVGLTVVRLSAASPLRSSPRR